MTLPIYELSGVEQRYGGKTALRVTDLAVGRESIVGLVGPNGSGKSTLLRMLAGLEKPADGLLRFDGKPMEPGAASVRLQVTMLDQEPYLLRRSVHDNVAYGLKIRGDRERVRERVEEALGWVGLDPARFAGRRWYQLSVGEAQRVALAARLVLRPRVLLLDEPTSSVDAASATLIESASLRAREQWGTTLVIASHDWAWLYEVSDEVLHLFDGRIIGSGPANVIFGPWEPGSDGWWEKRLPEGGRILAPGQPPAGAVAVVDPRSISVVLRSDAPAPGCKDGPAETVSDCNCLPGTVSGMMLQRRTGEVLVTVAVAGLQLTARMEPHQAGEAALYPGREVWSVFDPRAVRWL